MPSGPFHHRSPITVQGPSEFNQLFPDDDACLVFLWRAFHSDDGNTAHCPRCDDQQTFRRYETNPPRRSWTCTRCGFHLHPTVGTIFERSGTSLRTWFYAIYLLSHHDGRFSARRMQRELGVTYKTAWRIMRLIRAQTEAAGSLEALFDGRAQSA
jgi:transposase-like protein